MSSYRKADANSLVYWVSEAVKHSEHLLASIENAPSSTPDRAEIIKTMSQIVNRLRGLHILTKNSGAGKTPYISLSSDDAVVLSEYCPNVIDWYSVWVND